MPTPSERTLLLRPEPRALMSIDVGDELGHLYLPAGGPRRLPGHGHLVTQRAGGEQPDTPPQPARW